ncbi:hypothetical protein HHK36_023708 [Tetracentron sinense]|uniref:Uncharacterized protein n=1 Tax=Tetracentron sinense TaxID=13715 RepID=A0A834YLU8_TETSI|nr:hypothetical protein HHK36_023708 [Tetracentron sinense]
MGLWDVMYSTADTIKQNAPDLTPVKKACRSSYDLSWSAVSKINAARVYGIQKLSQYSPDAQGWDRIRTVSTNILKNTAHYGLQEGTKSVPGGYPVYKIISQSLGGTKSENPKKEESEKLKEEVKFMQAKMDKMEKDWNHYKMSLERTPTNTLQSDPIEHEKPEDIINNFMRKEFMGRNFLDALIVPGVRSRKNN